MQAIEVVGFISLGFFGLIGLVMTAMAVWEYVGTQMRLLKPKIGKEIEVREKHINEKGEAKKARLAKKRAVQNVIKDKKLEKKLGVVKAKTNEKYGEEVFDLNAPVVPPYVEPAYAEALSHATPPPAPSLAPAHSEVPPAPRPTIRPVIKPTPRPEGGEA